MSIALESSVVLSMASLVAPCSVRLPVVTVSNNSYSNSLDYEDASDVARRLHATTDRIRLHKNRLRINDLSAADNGVFDCRAENVAGAVNSSNYFVLSIPGTDISQLNFILSPVSVFNHIFPNRWIGVIFVNFLTPSVAILLQL